MEIKDENLLVAYQAGCADVKSTLKALFPGFEFEPKPRIEWPEDFKKYGAILFSNSRGSYNILAASCLGWRKTCISNGPDSLRGPDGYDKFWFTTLPGAEKWLREFEDQYPWVRTRNYIMDPAKTSRG